METKANHILIGAFVLALTALAFGFWYWLAGYGASEGAKRYAILFEGSVSGLTRASGEPLDLSGPGGDFSPRRSDGFGLLCEFLVRA